MSKYRNNLSLSICEELLGNKSRTIVPSLRETSVTRFVCDDGSIIAVKYQYTDVVRFFSNGEIVLNSAGWQTVTTKARMNAALRDTPYRVLSDKGVWVVYRDSQPFMTFQDGMILA
jgi:hypothetical protein